MTLEQLKILAVRSKVTSEEYPEDVVETYKGIAIVDDEDIGFTSKEQVDAFLEQQAEALTK